MAWSKPSYFEETSGYKEAMATILLYLRPRESISGIQYFQSGYSLSTLAYDYHRTGPDAQAYDGKDEQASLGP